MVLRNSSSIPVAEAVVIPTEEVPGLNHAAPAAPPFAPPSSPPPSTLAAVLGSPLIDSSTAAGAPAHLDAPASRAIPQSQSSDAIASGVNSSVEVTTVTTTTKTLPARTVSVIAPATLSAGFQFDADLDGSIITVTVPKEGVTEGQCFQSLVPQSTVTTTRTETTTVDPQPRDEGVPRGNWRDKLCCCLRYGLCHPMVCTSLWFPPLAIAQVNQRLRLNWMSIPATTEQGAERSFQIALWILVSYLVALFLFSWIVPWLASILTILYVIYVWYMGTRTRMYLRKKYDIQPKCCKGCNGCGDCCAVVWCTCCTAIQMGGHVNDYKKHQGVCCSKTGLDSSVPALV